MKYNYVLALILTATLAKAQQSVNIDYLAPMPIKTSNNAVVEGFTSNKTYVYSFGGIDETLRQSGIHNRAFRLDLQANLWEEIAPLPDSRGKIASSASRVGDTIYIIGGYYVNLDGTEESSAFVHRYDIINNVYLPNGQDLPVPIDDQVQVVNGPLIYVVTGWNNNRNVRNVQVYDTRTDSWSSATSLPNNNEYPAFGASGTIVDNTIYYYGGANGPGFPSRNELRIGVISETDPLDIQWSLAPATNRSTNYRNAATTIFGYPAWIGGSVTSYNFNGIAYNGSGGVAPAGDIKEQRLTGLWFEEIAEVPMDLRSVAELTGIEKVIAGGMKAGQEVTDETLLIEFGVTSTKDVDDTNGSFTFHPNPAENQITFTLGERTALNSILEIHNFSGQLISKVTVDNRSFDLDISGLEPGIYLVKIGESQRKLIVK